MDTALLNPPYVSAMTEALRNAHRHRIETAEKYLTTNRFATYAEYTEAFGVLLAARTSEADFKTIVGKFERK